MTDRGEQISLLNYTWCEKFFIIESINTSFCFPEVKYTPYHENISQEISIVVQDEISTTKWKNWEKIYSRDIDARSVKTKSSSSYHNMQPMMNIFVKLVLPSKMSLTLQLVLVQNIDIRFPRKKTFKMPFLIYYTLYS